MVGYEKIYMGLWMLTFGKCLIARVLIEMKDGE